MEFSETQNNTIQLGKLLIDELEDGHHLDTLSGWIAHYIAELISRVDSESGEAKEKAQSDCFDAIMRLWDHRYSEKVGFYGVREFKAIFETIEKLDPDNPRPIYFDYAESVEKDSKEVAQLLNFAESLDRITRRLLQQVLNLAAQAASKENTKKLLASASSINIPNDLRSIQLILQSNNIDEDSEPSKLESCLNELEAFADLIRSLTKALRNDF